ncbi:uncharacterized protein [Physcomitrium patens]|uniref:uncharacterized protein isoform X4 n=1 Tax=Physcomitrium patens TaxID=3218 RepID=UPI000D17B173|nr:uncharacterized protein LOC112294241 isoform X2 [Physcomitrium patens]|eukprot:XP_024400282.1 uncharacterized protein LOC112294241 isoform X2 [Physcomitrella patens]
MVGMDSRKNSGSPIPGLPRRRRDRASQDSSPAFQVQSLHTFGFSVILGRLAQIAVLDSRTVVYAIGSGLHRWRDGFAVPVSTPEDSVESIVAVVASSMGCIVGACELLKSKSSQVSVFDMRTQRKVGTSFIMQCNAEIEICAFSKDETIVVAAAKLEGGGSWLCCWELKHSQEKSADPYMGVAGAHIASGFGPIATIKVPHKMDYIHYFVEGTNLVCITWDTGDDPIVAASLSKDASLAVFILGSVTDMDFCHQRQVIASCGKDNMVRLWSCVTPSCRVAMRYEEEPIAVAIFQYLLIVAFQHRIMCYCLLAHTQANCVEADSHSQRKASQDQPQRTPRQRDSWHHHPHSLLCLLEASRLT